MEIEILKPLVDVIAQGNAVLFVGAGLSMGAGLPGWADLLAPLADELGLPADRRADLLQVAQEYVDAHNGNRQPLIDHIRRQTRTTGLEPTDNHLRLARLGIRTCRRCFAPFPVHDGRICSVLSKPYPSSSPAWVASALCARRRGPSWTRE